MSEEIIDVTEEVTEEKGTSMYVHQVDFETLKKVLHNTTDVNKLFIYNMPNKAEKYADSGVELINTLNDYIGGDEDWRIEVKKNVKFGIVEDKMCVDSWIINNTVLCLCIPRINSILIIPDENSTNNGNKEYTKILQLTNCIAVTPLLVKLTDEPIEGEESKFNLGMMYEVIVPKTEKPTE